MRTVRISWAKAIPIAVVVLITLYIVAQRIVVKTDLTKLNPQSFFYVKEITEFVGNDKLGNYEQKEAVRSGPGEMGKPYKLKEEQKEEEERLKSLYGFNQLVSDEISLDRTIPDMREPECLHWDYPDNLPKATVVFIFHNEGWSTLLRSVHSVINRSPAKLLHEIVLVDDKSELVHLHEKLEDELKKPFYQQKVKIVRNKEREGLIRSRNNGAVAATGEVVVFLDAHCEVGTNWLPPLLVPIYDDPKTLTVPVIDGIDWNDFSLNPVYSKGQHSRGIFEWGMLYKEGPLPDKEANKRKYHSEPYNSPTHAGGLFAIKRSWFKELGWYDPDLQIWGGENYELAFKLWQCGGRSLWVPCSRIGHVYRGHSCSSCHSGGVVEKWQGVPLALRNYKRLIETWWDEKYKKFFYTREPLAEFIDMGDISEQLALKKNLHCKSFTWFMTEVAYDVFDKFPEPPENTHWGEARNVATNLCIDTLSRSPPRRIGTSGCHQMGGNQLWRLNTEGQLSSGEWCVEYKKAESDEDEELIMEWCKTGSVNGPWQFQEHTAFFKHKDLGKCLVINDKKKLVLAECDSKNDHHVWAFNKITPNWVKNKKTT